MDPREYYKQAEQLHEADDCKGCPPAMKHRCNHLPGGVEDDDLCTLVVYAKLDMEDDSEAPEAPPKKKETWVPLSDRKRK